MNIGLSELNRRIVAQELTSLLADEFVLYTKTRNAHWNVVGRDFAEMHRFFETQYQQLDNLIDDVAERIRALGHFVPAALSRTPAITTLRDEDFASHDSASIMAVLLADHETIIRNLRNKISSFANEQEDLGTSDFVTALMQDHEKAAWLLRAHLQNG